jgi:hypothetical protein
MADVSQYSFSHTETITALIKAQGLREGLWQLTISFGFSAANIGENDKNLNPAAILAVTAVGLRRVTESSNLTVDAAVANPAT